MNITTATTTKTTKTTAPSTAVTSDAKFSLPNSGGAKFALTGVRQPLYDVKALGVSFRLGLYAGRSPSGANLVVTTVKQNSPSGCKPKYVLLSRGLRRVRSTSDARRQSRSLALPRNDGLPFKFCGYTIHTETIGLNDGVTARVTMYYNTTFGNVVLGIKVSKGCKSEYAAFTLPFNFFGRMPSDTLVV